MSVQDQYCWLSTTEKSLSSHQIFFLMRGRGLGTRLDLHHSLVKFHTIWAITVIKRHRFQLLSCFTKTGQQPAESHTKCIKHIQTISSIFQVELHVIELQTLNYWQSWFTAQSEQLVPLPSLSSGFVSIAGVVCRYDLPLAYLEFVWLL